MAEHSLSYIPLSDLTIVVNGQTNPSWAYNTNDGKNLVDNPTTFAFAPDAEFVTLTVTDDSAAGDDNMFSDDDNADYVDNVWGPDGTAQRDQATGNTLEAEYKLTLTSSDGTTYDLVAVKSGGNIIGFAFDTATGVPPFGETLSVTAQEDSYVVYDPPGVANYYPIGIPYDSMVTCFTRGTMIATPRGEVAIETLAEGDLVLTRDNGPQPIRWIGSSRQDRRALARSENLRPIRIRAGALGAGVPAADLVVSPQHRVLVRSHIAQRMFGTAEVLVAAKQLLQLDGIDIADDLTEVQYFHILFDRHEVVLSNGAETESLYTGPMALKSVGRQARDEIFAIFPELRETTSEPPSARPLASGRQARKLAIRHIQNGKDLVSKMRNPCMS